MEVLEHLQNIYFFEHLTPDEMAALAGIFKARQYLPHDEIVRQGDITSRFFIVDSGFVNLRQTDRQSLEKAVGSKGPNEYFGVKMFTNQEISEFTFEAVGAAMLYVLDREDWDGLVENFPSIPEHMPELQQEFQRLTRGLEWLSPGEAPSLITRRHPWSLVLMARNPAIFALIATVVFYLTYRFGLLERFPLILPVYGICLFLAVVWTVWNILDWWNDTYIVTNQRVVRINRILFLSYSRSEIPIEKIQQEEVRRGGPISVFLNISDLHILSAAVDTAGVVFEDVGDVLMVQRVIDTERSRVDARRRAAQRERMRDLVAKEVHHYVFQQPPEAEKKVTPMPAGFRARLRWMWRGSPSQPIPLGVRLGMLWVSFFGTEIRTERSVTWRKYYTVLVRQTIVAFFALLLLLALLGVIIGTNANFGLARNGVYFGLGTAIVVALGVVIWQWLDWRVDLYRLTDTEIVDIESLPFGLRYSEKKAELGNLQDVNFSRPGFLHTLLDFGNVEARVAGNAPPFTFFGVPHPANVAGEIQTRTKALTRRREDAKRRQQAIDMVDAIVAYHRLVTADEAQKNAAPPPALIVPAPVPAEPPPAVALPPPQVEGEFPPETEFSD